MARIPTDEIERLKSEVAVERLVEASGIALTKAGKDLLGKCPFHEDASASLVVTPAKNLWHCFGCGAAGGPIDWVMKKDGVSFRHAIELLRENVVSTSSLAARSEVVTRSSVRRLEPPVSFDAGEQELLNQTVGYYHETLEGLARGAGVLGSPGAEPCGADRSVSSGLCQPHARVAPTRENSSGRCRHPHEVADALV